MFRLLRANADLRWLFLAQVVSFMGDWFSVVAISGMIDDATGSTFLVSLVVVVLSLPSFLCSPLAGSVVDRFDRRRVLMVVSAVQAVAASGFLLASPDRLWVLFVCAGVVSGLAAFVKPAIDAAVPVLARDAEELRMANTLLGSTWGVMLAVGAAAGGLFSDAFGRRAAFVADAGSFVLALGLVTMIVRPMQQPRETATRQRIRPMADMGEAVRYARQDHVVLALIASKATFAIGAGSVSLLPVLASRVFGWGDDGRGLLMAARGLGIGMGPLIAVRFTRGNIARVLQVCGIAGCVFSIGYLLGTWSPVLPIAALFLTLAHLGGGAQWTLSTYGLQLRAPDAIRGRVMAGDFAIVTLVVGLTSLLAGVMAEAIGVRWAMSAFAVTAFAAGATYLAITAKIGRPGIAPPAAAAVASGRSTGRSEGD